MMTCHLAKTWKMCIDRVLVDLGQAVHYQQRGILVTMVACNKLCA